MQKPLMFALAAVLGLVGWLSSQEQDDGVEVVASQRPASASAAAPVTAAASTPGRPNRAMATEALSVQQAMLSGLQGWRARRAEASALPPARPMTSASPSAWSSQLPPPPPPPRSAEPAEPVAPRFPHEWVGRYDDASKQRAVLSGPLRTWVVGAGEVIEGQWRIDRIQERTMTLTYLPLQQSQTVSMK